MYDSPLSFLLFVPLPSLQEREEAAKAVGNPAEHAELLERIIQINIHRKNNATLRAESDAHLRKARQPRATLHSVQSELGLLKEGATTLRVELDAKNAQIQRLEDENRRWKERNSQLLTKVRVHSECLVLRQDLTTI